MSELAKEVISVSLEEELKQSYLDYAMSVIVGRALPDVRDGLKPVHRRVLFAMSELGNDYNKPYKKSARIVGDVIGKYHPHGESAVYDTIVRMAQPFTLRYMLVDGQGNFGSVDGDAPAAMRYTEVRMSPLAHALLADLEKDTVDFIPNYDESESMPLVLPTRVPNLLINGSSGIAVGMATNIPPHNLTEIITACLAIIDQPEIDLLQLMQLVPGPDFPTGGIIYGRNGIIEAYQTGRGRIYIRAKTHFETDEKTGKQAIIVDELPYQVNKAHLLERIGELVKEKQLEGLSAIRDESDKDGMRVVIELKRNENPEIVLNNLLAHTQLQVVYGINMVALEQGQPKLLNLKQLIDAFLRHRREVVTRRTLFELRKARERIHILEGLAIALANIDEMIALIKASPSPAEAREKLLAKAWQPGIVVQLLEKAGSTASRPEGLTEAYGLLTTGYHLSPVQAQAILELRLHRLTGLEQDKIIAEYQELLAEIARLLEILEDPERLLQVIREELTEIKQRFGDARRTEIAEGGQMLTHEDLIPDETIVVTLSHQGYAKTQSMADYETQHRGGRGKLATAVKEEDFVEQLIIANALDTILCFSNRGKVYWLKAYQIPQAGRTARGRPLVNLLPLEAEERINALMRVRIFCEDHYIFMVTAHGVVKKVPLSRFANPRSGGIIAVELDAEDYLVGVNVTDGTQQIMLFSDAGKVISFHEEEVRPMGRTARGVRGIRLQEGQRVIALSVACPNGAILTATEKGYGKRTLIEDYRITGRGGQGVISIQVNERNGLVVGAVQVYDGDEILLISDRGTLVRTRVDEVSVVGRNTQGVRLINLPAGEKLVGIQRIAELVSGVERRHPEIKLEPMAPASPDKPTNEAEA